MLISDSGKFAVGKLSAMAVIKGLDSNSVYWIPGSLLGRLGQLVCRYLRTCSRTVAVVSLSARSPTGLRITAKTRIAFSVFLTLRQACSVARSNFPWILLVARKDIVNR